MHNWKYIIVEIDYLPTPVAFPPTLQHVDVFDGLRHRFRLVTDVKALSAGFLRRIGNKLETVGASDSLGVGSLVSDAQYFNT
jgi:hypothetical protein